MLSSKLLLNRGTGKVFKYFLNALFVFVLMSAFATSYDSANKAMALSPGQVVSVDVGAGGNGGSQCVPVTITRDNGGPFPVTDTTTVCYTWSLQISANTTVYTAGGQPPSFGYTYSVYANDGHSVGGIGTSISGNSSAGFASGGSSGAGNMQNSGTFTFTPQNPGTMQGSASMIFSLIAYCTDIRGTHPCGGSSPISMNESFSVSVVDQTPPPPPRGSHTCTVSYGGSSSILPGQSQGYSWSWDFQPPYQNSGGGIAQFNIVSDDGQISVTQNPTSQNNLWTVQAGPSLTTGAHTFSVTVGVTSDEGFETIPCNSVSLYYYPAPVPPSINLISSKRIVNYGENTDLTVIKNPGSGVVGSCYINGPGFNSSPIGIDTPLPSIGLTSNPSDFTATCTGPDGLDTDTERVKVKAKASLTANPQRVTYGGVSTLDWACQNSDSNTPSGFITNNQASGRVDTSAIITPTTYSITCKKDNDPELEDTALANVDIAPPNSISCVVESQTGNTATIRGIGGYGSYRWSASGGSVSPTTGALGSSTVFTGSHGASYTVNLQDEVPQTTTCQVSIPAAPEPPYVDVKGKHVPSGYVSYEDGPLYVPYGSNVLVAWSSSGNPNSCVVNGWPGFSGSDYQTGSLDHSITIQARCSKQGFSDATDELQIIILPPPNMTCTATPTSVYVGNPINVSVSGAIGSISWNTSGGSISGSGTSVSVTYASAGSYTITAQSSSGQTATCPVVVVQDVPTLSCTVTSQNQNSATVQGNGGVGGYYWSSNAGSLSPTSGPIGSSTTLTGNPGGNYQVTLRDVAGQNAVCSFTLPVPNIPPELDIKGSHSPSGIINSDGPMTVPYGADVQVSWVSLGDPDSCTINFVSGSSSSLTGSAQTGPLTQSITVTGQCNKQGYSPASDTLQINVLSPSALSCQIDSISPTSAVLRGSGGEGSYTWSSNAGSLSPTSGPIGSSTTLTGNPGGNYQVTLRDSASQQSVCSVALPALPPSVNLTANPSTLSDGGTTNLSWASQNSDFCMATQGPGFSFDTSIVNGTDDSNTLSYALPGPRYEFSIYCSGPWGAPDSDTVWVTVTSPNLPPSASISANPNRVSLFATTDITWTSENTTGCNVTSGLAQGFDTQGRVAGTVTTQSLSQPQTFSISCPSSNGFPDATASVFVDINTPEAFISASPNPVTNGNRTDVNWWSNNANFCTEIKGPGFVTQGYPSGTVSSNPLPVTGPGTAYEFTVYCSGPTGFPSSASVWVGVIDDAIVGDLSVSSSVYNTSTATRAGLSVACGQIISTWTSPSGPVDGFRMYYYDSARSAWRQLWDIPFGSAQVVGNGVNSRFFNRFTPPGADLTGLYRYRIYTYVGNQEFIPAQDSTGSPVATDWPCNSDFTGSNKDIVKIRDIDLPYDTHKDQDSDVASAVPVLVGDLITFQINVLNSGEVPFSGEIVVDDYMTNLAVPDKGWDIQIDCNNECDHKVIDFDPVTHRMTFVLTSRNGQSLGSGSVEVWTIRFVAKAQAEDVRRTTFRFQNRAYINGTTSNLLATPSLLVLPVGSLELEEIQ